MPEVNVVVVFYSRYGRTEQLALAAGVGAVQAHANIRLRRLKDLADPETIARDRRWAENLERMNRDYIAPREIDVDWADVLLVASCPDSLRETEQVRGSDSGHARQERPFADRAASRHFGRHAGRSSGIGSRASAQSSRERTKIKNVNTWVCFERDEDVAVITIDNAPVNALSSGVVEGLKATIERANADAEVRAIVVIGSGRTFIAGADVHEFQKPTAGEYVARLRACLSTIEDSAKPVVMAIHGAALGGGLETAMAGHYRLIAPSAQVGQPEVKLGLIPGAGGTQRLPRLAGVAKAVEMCAFGAPVKAQEVLAAGIVDRIIDGDLRAGAVEFAREVADKPIRRTRDRNERLVNADPAIFSGRARAGAQKNARTNGPARGHRRGGGGYQTHFRRRSETRSGIVRSVPAVPAVKSAHLCFFRGARRDQGPRHIQQHAHLRHRARGHRRRGHYGRRYRHGLRQRRDSGAY